MQSISLYQEITEKFSVYKNEFLYVRLPSIVHSITDEQVAAQVDKLSEMTEVLYISVADTFKGLDPDTLFDAKKAKWFGFTINLKEKNSDSETHTIFSNVDVEAVKKFEMIVRQVKYQGSVIPELAFFSDHMLGPTIWEFFQRFNLPFLFLRVSDSPNAQEVLRVKEAFEYLRIRGFKKNIYFTFDNPCWDEWNKKTLNTFSGISTVHLDLSNKCTHSCVFCGLWGPDFIEETKKNSEGNKLSDSMKNFMNKQMSHEKAIEVLKSLPFTVREVQFGGAGDPLTHPNWLDIITRWRSRGMDMEVLSNYEYPSIADLDLLHRLGRGEKKFRFIVNISAATAEVYKLVRPRQTKEVFDKVISNIRYSAMLRNRDGYGVDIVMLQIINLYNYKEAVKMIELAAELGVAVWLKPLEVHGPIHKKFTIPFEDYDEFKIIMSRVLAKAEELKVKLLFKEYIEKIIFA
ncbi:MAG: hypothetical protein H7336_17215 [Bacteriovorax sp.]|nr:hypothetical protein [Bacteriovorax sp.]